MFDGSNWVCTSSVNGKWSDGATSGDIVYTGGNVGIGTTSPDEALHVEGSLLVDAYNTSDPSSSGIFFREGYTGEYTTDDPQPYNASITLWDGSNNGASYDGLSINGYDGVVVRTGSNEVPSLVVPSSGKVGIGTTSPSATLDVRSGEKTGTNTLARFSTAEDANQQLLYIQNIENTGMLIQATESSVSNNNLLLNRYGGNVGIATLSPDAKLDVEGSLQADTFTGEASIYTHAQDITTSGAVDVEYFSIDIHGAPRSSAAFVNEVSGTVDIHYFDYSGAGLTVGEFQPATTITGFTSPNDAESFLHNNITYLVVGDDSEYADIYEWNVGDGEFNLLSGDEISVSGHIDTEVFDQDDRQIIALAQSNGIELREWEGNGHSRIQSIELNDIHKLYFFEADLNADDATEAYLAAAAGDNLFIYQWQNGQNFDPLTLAYTLEAPSAQNAHYFVVDDRQFLMVPSDRDDIDSPLYEWNGTEFEVAQTFDTYSGSVAATNFALNGTQYLVLTAKGQSTNDYLLFYWYEDDQFNYRRMIVSDNTSGGLADIELSLTGGEDRLILVEGNISRVLRIEHATNAKIADDLWVAGQDIMMDDMNATQGTSDGISYDDYDALGSEGVFSFHADQERRPGWNDPGAAISAKGGYFSGNVGIGTTDPDAKLEVAGLVQANAGSELGWNSFGLDYFHDSNTGKTHHYWNRIGRVGKDGASNSITFEIILKHDVNYPHHGRFLLIASGFSGHSYSVALSGNNAFDYLLEAGIDEEGYVWVRPFATWTHHSSWRVLYNRNGAEVLKDGVYQEEDPAGFVQVRAGEAKRATHDGSNITGVTHQYSGIYGSHGTVGIGTTSPQSQLHVNGDIIADRVSGKNIFPFQYASWEVGSDGDAVEFSGPDDVTLNVSTDYSFDGKRSLKQTTQSIDGWAYYYPSNGAKYNIPVKPSTTYIYSVYARVPDGADSVSTQIYIRMNDASGTHKSNAGTASTDWTRTSLLFTTGSDVNAIAIRTDVDPASDTEATIYFDGFMLEEAVFGQTEPSAWTPSAASYGITVDSKENVGIGTTDTNQTRLQVVKDSGSILKAGTSTDKNMFNLISNGTMEIAGNVVQTSDSRYKKEIQTLPSALKNILSLRGVSYYWKDRDDDTQQIGVIAQEVEKIYPQLVHTNEDGYKSVAYANLVSPLIEAVKELHALYQGHADRLAALEAQNAELETQNAHQDERIAHQDELIVQLEVRLAALEAAQ